MHHSLSTLFLNCNDKTRHDIKNLPLITFITIVIFTAFYSTLIFFFNYGLSQALDSLKPVVTCHYELYLHFSFIFALISVGLCIFGCYTADEKLKRGLLSFLVLSAMMFIFELTFIAYLMRFKGNFIEMVKNNYESEKYWNVLKINNNLNCSENCGEKLVKVVGGKIDSMIFYVFGLILWQVRNFMKIFLKTFEYFLGV